MGRKRKVILITDGDVIAKTVIEETAKKIGGRCISLSAGNPTPFSGEEILEMIKQTPKDPVLVMFDDNGHRYKGDGEKALEYIANHPDITVLGVLAVASNTTNVNGVKVDFSIDRNGRITRSGVNKDGDKVGGPLRIYGDTVDVLNRLEIPLVIGIGDIGKMGGKDSIKKGSPITYKAIKLIMEWGEQHEEKNEVTRKK
ncbi:stage V sporulation protein AE [Vulcanibacillus modesticaldus]|uniref:Stage V sporulation protein AE n=1 Tax=Vulcanibacillus modesticaldus TaxID=337097 RepID=A0A1D2YSF2_9BACI|nr:stage V sporulation protein AE [Vulcanibacillus modesticaldus]OEF97244.1 stage V sporulation protein AE [Vulcanibacillus modesticaldus]